MSPSRSSRYRPCCLSGRRHRRCRPAFPRTFLGVVWDQQRPGWPGAEPNIPTARGLKRDMRHEKGPRMRRRTYCMSEISGNRKQKTGSEGRVKHRPGYVTVGKHRDSTSSTLFDHSIGSNRECKVGYGVVICAVRVSQCQARHAMH